MVVRSVFAWNSSLNIAASAIAVLFLLFFVSGCNEAKLANQPVANADTPEAESVAEQQAAPLSSESTSNTKAVSGDSIEVTVDPSANEAVLVRADTPSDSLEETTEGEENVESELGRPTHKQIATIEVNSGDLEETSLHSFCLSAEGNVMAACGDAEEGGEIRIFDPEGAYLSSWEVPVKPEAINVGSDGNIYVAGNGRLVKLNDQGEVLLQKESPQVAALNADTEKIREEVIEREEKRAARRSGSQAEEQLAMYQKMIDQLSEKGEENLNDREKKTLAQLQKVHEQFKAIVEEKDSNELTEERIEELVASTIEYKMRTASISEQDGDVFVATGATAGYGYQVWRLDNEFENAESIVDGLRGCCGQMDVQACNTGIYVAENSRHRVVRFDRSGEKLTSWGSKNRSGLRGFGSCCNPMNVAFGPAGTVYTAESNTGRIKQFDNEGQLLALVGRVDLVPGCKKVAIGVNEDGSRVYMLDITRNTILVMGRLAPGESVTYSETDQGDGASSGVLNIVRKAVGL